MTKAELRNLALLLRSRVVEVFDAISPAYGEAASWSLNLSDAALPTVEQVKAVFLAYEALKKPPLALYDELRDLRNAETTTPLPALSLSVAWEAVTGKPTTFTPSEHTHEAQAVAWEAVTGKPATFPPAEHTHAAAAVAWTDVTDKPATFTPHMAMISYVGNGLDSRVISFPGDFYCRFIFLHRPYTGTLSYLLANENAQINNDIINQVEFTASTTWTKSEFNWNGNIYNMILWG